MLNTIGYEGSSVADLISTLQFADVTLVADVRERPQSRRPGFSKAPLTAALAAAGIDYVHYPELGDPKEGREAARAQNWSRFRQIFRAVLEAPAAKKALSKIAADSVTRNVCLLCYERDPTVCHRGLVAANVANHTGKATRHLGVRSFEQARKCA